MTADTNVTICVTPRERFSGAIESLRSIVSNTDSRYQLVYIDANSPASIGSTLQDICLQHGFRYVRKDEYLSPNQSRNLGLSLIDTRYVAFVDNDLFVDKGWLASLVECAQESGAWAVGPIILEGTAYLRVVHMAGGDLREETHNGSNSIHYQHRYLKQPLKLVRHEMKREPTGYFEFHCVLVRTNVFPQREFLDEGFMCNNEHIDLAREIHKAGGQVYFEPSSVVRYDTATPFEACDREFFELRWSSAWSQQSIAHMRSKWGLADDDIGMQKLANWTAGHRRLFEQSQKPWLRQNLPTVIKRAAGAWLRRRGLLSSGSAG